FSTFNHRDSDHHVYKSVNAGQDWAIWDGTAPNSVPDVPVHQVLVHPSNSSILYLGTDMGIMTSVDGGLNWGLETEFPTVSVASLSFNTVGGVTSLYAFTHGRGAWRAELGDITGPTVNLTSPVAGEILTGTVLVHADASDSSSIDHVDFIL